ncbi:hypothetical protein AAHU69_05715 [Klebsiella pneumoniae]
MHAGKGLFVSTDALAKAQGNVLINVDDLSTPAAPNPVDNLEAVAWQPQPGRATGRRSFFEQEKLPRRAAR